jgi:hypothetical protein
MQTLKLKRTTQGNNGKNSKPNLRRAKAVDEFDDFKSLPDEAYSLNKEEIEFAKLMRKAMDGLKVTTK